MDANSSQIENDHVINDDDENTDPDAIKQYLICQREKLKASRGGPIADKYLGEEMLIPLLKSLSEKTILFSQEDPPRNRVTLAFAKAEWEKHKHAWLQLHARPGQQKKRPPPGQKWQRPPTATNQPAKQPLRAAPPPNQRAGPPPTCAAAAKKQPLESPDSVTEETR